MKNVLWKKIVGSLITTNKFRALNSPVSLRSSFWLESNCYIILSFTLKLKRPSASYLRVAHASRTSERQQQHRITVVTNICTVFAMTLVFLALLAHTYPHHGIGRFIVSEETYKWSTYVFIENWCTFGVLVQFCTGLLL